MIFVIKKIKKVKIKNKIEAIKERSKNRYKNLSDEKNKQTERVSKKYIKD